MTTPNGRYIVWQYTGSGYIPYFYMTLVEAVISQKSSDDWYLTEALVVDSVYASAWQAPKKGVKE